MAAPPKKKPGSKGPAAKRATYHHGNLKEDLISATLALIEEHGPENVSLRDVAKHAGVSSGAPFRHFADRAALMTAVAEEAMLRFKAEVVSTLEGTKSTDPLVRFRAVGYAYLRWAVKNPSHFLVISNRRLIHFEASDILRNINAEIQQAMVEFLSEAKSKGLLRSDDTSRLPLIARAVSYGLARMYVDGHLPQWGVDKQHWGGAIEKALDQFIEGIATDAWLKSKGS
jgi:AcrR family transcriptional regulator